MLLHKFEGKLLETFALSFGINIFDQPCLIELLTIFPTKLR